MFTQKISMDCTKEQYEKYLKEELLKMGYKEHSINCWDDNKFCHINNNYNGYLGALGTIREDSIEDYDRTYLGAFNAPLFLALAAMTDKAEGNYGEYIIGLGSRRLYKMTEGERILPEYNLIRKATKEELMARFQEANKGIRLAIDITTNTDSEAMYYGTIGELISTLKSKGYKILKPKAWEEV